MKGVDILIIGKLIIFHGFLRHEVFQNSQWFTRYRGLKVPYLLSPSFWYNVLDLKSFYNLIVEVCAIIIHTSRSWYK